MKVFRNILLICIALFGITITAAYFLGRHYEQEITRFAVDRINRQINTEIFVDKVRLSFIKKFPDATLEFSDVLVSSVQGCDASVFRVNTDTLMYASRLYLQFDVWHLLKNEYLLKELHMQSGMVRILTDTMGRTNYEFWNAGPDRGNGDFNVELKNVRLTDMRLDYLNRSLDLETGFYFDRCALQGRVSAGRSEVDLNLSGNILHYRKEGHVFLEDQPVSAGVSLLVSPELIDLRSGKLQLAGQKIMLDGSVKKTDPMVFDLALSGEDLKIGTIIRYLATGNEKLPEGMEADGVFSFDATISGEGGKTRMPGIQASFEARDTWIRTGKLTNEIRQLRARGTYTNGSGHSTMTTEIGLQDISLMIGNSRIGGDLSFTNLESPEILHNIQMEIDLADLRQVTAVNSIVKDLQGRLLARVSIAGRQASLLKFSRDDLLNNEYKARISFENAGFTLSSIPLSEVNGELTYDGHLQIGTISALIASNPVSFSGRGDNLREYLFTDEGNLWLDLDVYSSQAGMDAFFPQKRDAERATDTLGFPDRIYLKSRFWFDRFSFRDFSAGNVMGDVFYQPGRLEVRRLDLSSMNGMVKAKGSVELLDGQNLQIKVASDVSRLDIKQTFTAFRNFGQEFIMDRHLEGSLSGNIHFTGLLNKKLRMEPETILSDLDIVIRDGALVGFGPMQKLSRFIDVEELENIRFSTLDNQVFIRDREILIPRMDINSSAFNISGSGIHGFDREFEYKVKVALSEILSGKARKPDRQAEEFGAIEDDELGNVYLYLIIEGSNEGTDVRYDRRGAVQNLREDFREERTEIREILNEEFGLFGRDSTLGSPDKESSPPGFIIEWEEDPGSDSLKKEILNEDNKSGGQGFTIRWEEEETTDTLEETAKRKGRLFKKR